MKIFILQVFCAVFSGAIEGISISSNLFPQGIPLLALFSLAPLYFSLYNCRKFKQAGFLFALQALTVHLISSAWLANFHGFAVFTLGASALGTMAEAFACGVIAFIYPSTAWGAKKDRLILEENAGIKPYAIFKRALWFAFAWLFWEFMKSSGDLGYPWGTLFMASYKWRLISQVADITGVWGITFIFALFSALIGEGFLLLSRASQAQDGKKIISSYKQLAIFTFTIFGAVLVYGIYKYCMPITPEKTFKAIVVQQNMDPWETDELNSIERSMKLTEEQVNLLAENEEEADLIIWSEGVLTRSFPGASEYYETHPEDRSLSDFINMCNTPFLIGGKLLLNRQKRDYVNSAILFDSRGQYSGFYGKMHLVPFAEGIPYADSAIMKAIMSNMVGFSRGWQKGRQLVLFQVPIKARRDISTPLEYQIWEKGWNNITLEPNGRIPYETREYYSENNSKNPDAYVSFTTPICFEDAFDDVCSRLYKAGSEVFINMTNDSWSKSDAAEYQHFIAASFRAIAYRTTLVRSCNSGYSAVVDPTGRIVKDLPLFKECAMTVDVPVYERKHTVYSRLGNWLPCISIIIICLLAIYFIAITWNWPKRTRRRFITISFNTEYLADKEEYVTDLTLEDIPQKKPEEELPTDNKKPKSAKKTVKDSAAKKETSSKAKKSTRAKSSPKAEGKASVKVTKTSVKTAAKTSPKAATKSSGASKSANTKTSAKKTSGSKTATKNGKEKK